jgi:hypothetical protein
MVRAFMAEIKNPLEIYKALPKTNCGHCGVPSCMAFAASVLQGMKTFSGCPYLDKTVIEQLSPRIIRRRSMDDDYMEVIRQLQQQVQLLDFIEVAPRIGAQLIGGKLAINCLGRDFFIDQGGEMTSACHVNHWLYVPLLHYVLECQGTEPANDWVPFGDLPGAGQWNQYFSHRCEEALRQLADAHHELVFEMFFLFGAQPIAATGGADHSLAILPLPKVPFLINYWQEGDGFPSELNILLDRSAGRNINARSITLLARGIVEMFRQLIISHSREGKLF